MAFNHIQCKKRPVAPTLNRSRAGNELFRLSQVAQLAQICFSAATMDLAYLVSLGLPIYVPANEPLPPVQRFSQGQNG